MQGDVPAPEDYDGDGKGDIAVWRPSSGVWWVLTSSSNFTTFLTRSWGMQGDVPAPEDYDGDGKSDIAVWRPSSGVWWVLTSSSNFTTFLTRSWGVTAMCRRRRITTGMAKATLPCGGRVAECGGC